MARTKKRPPRPSTGALAGGPVRTAEDERADVIAWFLSRGRLGIAFDIKDGRHVGAADRARKEAKS